MLSGHWTELQRNKTVPSLTESSNLDSTLTQNTISFCPNPFPCQGSTHLYVRRVCSKVFPMTKGHLSTSDQNYTSLLEWWSTEVNSLLLSGTSQPPCRPAGQGQGGMWVLDLGGQSRRLCVQTLVIRAELIRTRFLGKAWKTISKDVQTERNGSEQVRSLSSILSSEEETPELVKQPAQLMMRGLQSESCQNMENRLPQEWDTRTLKKLGVEGAGGWDRGLTNEISTLQKMFTPERNDFK